MLFIFFLGNRGQQLGNFLWKDHDGQDDSGRNAEQDETDRTAPLTFSLASIQLKQSHAEQNHCYANQPWAQGLQRHTQTQSANCARDA